jgi:hypothetical protein
MKKGWICHILLRNCVLEHVTEGQKGGAEGQGKILKQLLDDLKEKNGYCKLKEAALGSLFGEIALEEAVDLS